MFDDPKIPTGNIDPNAETNLGYKNILATNQITTDCAYNPLVILVLDLGSNI
jgi:hypothetical protein